MEYWLTRLCLQRSLGLTYFIAFLIAFNQGKALIGANDLLPMRLFLAEAKFWDAPSLFWLGHSDAALTAVAVAGLGLAALAVTGKEIILEGTRDELVTDETVWIPYEFKAKPGDVRRRPPQVSPYLPKLDWQVWFAAMGSYRHYPWILNLCAKLLQGDAEVLGLLGANPFPGGPPPWIRAERYLYRFAAPGEKAQGAYWAREYAGEYLPPLSLKQESFQNVLRQQGWL